MYWQSNTPFIYDFCFFLDIVGYDIHKLFELSEQFLNQTMVNNKVKCELNMEGSINAAGQIFYHILRVMLIRILLFIF